MAKTHEQFLKEIKEKNNKVEIIGQYNGSINYVRAKCKRCGNEWEAKAYSLLNGRACPKCRTLRGTENNQGKTKKKTHKEFLNELSKIDEHIEVLSEYKSYHSFIKCRCKRCGNEWEVKAYSLLNGHGCPRCAKSGTSFMEQFIKLSFEKALSKDDVLSRDRKTIGMELDIVIPKLKLAIEPGNWYLHKKNIKRDGIKRNLCEKKKIKLITIYNKFPQNEKVPFKDNCIVFKDDYNKADHSEIKKLVINLFKIANIENKFNEKQWREIENKAYENAKAKTHNDFIIQLKNVNPTIIVLGKYTNSNRRLLVKCKNCGYEWNGVPASLLNGDGCKKCGTLKAHEKFLKDKNSLVNELAEKNPNIEIIGDYKGRHKPIHTKCKICGYEWNPIVSSLLRGSNHKNSKSLHKSIKK